jgi:hypothetical protein
MGETSTERRKSKRYDLDWPVCLWHELTQRFYTGRSINISSTGALIHIPLTVPLRTNEKVELNFPPPENSSDMEHSPAKVFSAQVIRVNRGQSILEANQAVALRFC